MIFRKILILVFFLSLIFIVQNSYADTTYRGFDYSDSVNLNGVHTWRGGLVPYIQDINNNYVPYLFSNGNQVETNYGSIILNANGTYSFYKKGIISTLPLFTDTIIGKYADVSNLNSWTYLNTLNNDIPDISFSNSQFISSKIQSGIGKLDYKYIINNGHWKTQLEATNLSALTTKAFGFDQIIDLNTDTIYFGNQIRNLDDFNNTTYNHTWLVNNKGKVLDFLNDINFDFDLGFDNLYSVTIYDTGINSSRLIFDYRTSVPLLSNQTLVIDPTFSYATATNYSITTGAVSPPCQTGSGFTRSSLDADAYTFGADVGDLCVRLMPEWNISTISNSEIVVSDTKIRYDVDLVTSARVCSFYSMLSQPSVSAVDINLWNAINSTASYVLSDTGCQSATNDKVLDLGTQADTDIQTAKGLNQNWFAVGIKQHDESSDGAVHRARFLNIELQVEYTVNTVLLTTPKELIANAVSNSQIDLSWKSPYYFNGTLIGYKIDYESPRGNGFTTLIADTGNTDLTYSVTGLLSNVEYNFKVFAITNNTTSLSSNQAVITTFTTGDIERTSLFTPQWNILPNAIVLDTDQDGNANQVYTYDVTGQSITVIKALGNGISNTTITMPTTETLQTVNVAKDMILFSSGKVATSVCTTSLHSFNTTSGLIFNSNVTASFNGGGGIASLGFVLGTLNATNFPVLHSVCNGATTKQYSISSSNNLLLNATSSSSTVYGYTSNLSWSNISSNHSTDGITIGTFLPNSTQTLSGVCSSSGCLTTSSSLPRYIKPITSSNSTGATIDSNVVLYNGGLKLPSGHTIQTANTYWSNYLPIFSGTDSNVVSLLYFKLLDSTLTTDPYRFIFNDTDRTYVIYLLGTTIKYSSIVDSTLADRNSAFYYPDKTPDVFDTSLTTTPLDTNVMYIVTPVTNTLVTNQGLVSIISGYYLKTDDLTVVREGLAVTPNPLELTPYILGNNASLVQLSVLVKNAPSSGAVDVRDTQNLLLSRYYSWNTGFIKADKTFAVDLPYPKCVDIYIKDLTVIGSAWENVGNLCNTGVMPKIITYTANLSFTFWSLPYGVSHTFNNTSDLLVTKVRHDTNPFNYTVKIFDSNSVLQYENEFMENVDEIDTQVINASGIAKPALMRVYDVNGNQLYYTTLGIAGYLSGTVQWFNTWLTIEGFNLLFMLPIVFGAMFTRNTVGIGTMSTVTLIATLTWFGILPISDIAIYLMIFIAVIGVIAYKKLYD